VAFDWYRGAREVDISAAAQNFHSVQRKTGAESTIGNSPLFGTMCDIKTSQTKPVLYTVCDELEHANFSE
jgi:hypothetical protein